MKCPEGHLFDDSGIDCPECYYDQGVRDERKRCAELVVRESPTLGQQLAAKIHETGDL